MSLGACGSGALSNDPGPPVSILNPAVETVTFASEGGGFHGLPPAEAPCDPAQWTYIITLATHHVLWMGCSVTGSESDPGSYAVATMDRALDGSAWSATHSALADVTVSTETRCGADKDRWSLSVQTASATTTYGDDFYACEQIYTRYVVSNTLDHFYTELSQLP